jgi:sigma-54 dependent transcriptional regulator, acetoin dehydrogenase operon transcriptional activator AcoR
VDRECGPKGRVRDDLARVLRGQPPSACVRDEIVASWRESASVGLRHDVFAPPYDGDFGEADECRRAAEPVLEQLGTDLSATDITVVLSDEEARIVLHRVPHARHPVDHPALRRGYLWRVETSGTNALGLASAACAPMVVHGDEHFMDVLTELTMASGPVIDPRTGGLAGAVTLVCPAADANALLLPFARRAASEVEHRLLDDCSAEQRFLEQQFRSARRRTRGPLALVGRHTLLLNAAASRVLTSEDQARLWTHAEEALTLGRTVIAPVGVPDGAQFGASIEPVRAGGEIAGALLRFRVSGGTLRDTRKGRATVGWESLTETELSLAELVAEGLTNRETAARLIMSPHTVDSHLRHIFTKLGINSRVELAHLVAARMPDHVVA